MEPVKILYRPNIYLYFCRLCFAFAFASLFYRAAHDSKDIYPVINMLASLAMAAYGLYYLLEDIIIGTSKKWVIADASGISVPKNPFSKDVINIQYRQITKLEIKWIYGAIAISYNDKKLFISSRYFASKSDYNKVANVLNDKVNTPK